MRVIAVANQKGGTGKTTTACAILSGAKLKGKKALGIDFDPSGSLTFITGADGNRGSALNGAEIQHTACGDIIAAGMDLVTISNTESLRDLISRKEYEKKYNIIVIDCPPVLGRGLACALRAATEILIPLQADTMSLQGLYLLHTTIKQINPEAKILGAFLAKHSGRSILARDMTEQIKQVCKSLDIPYLDTPIRSGIAIQEAQAMQQGIFDYAPNSKPAQDYAALLKKLKI